MAARAYLGLGSNLGDRLAYLQLAVDGLAATARRHGRRGVAGLRDRAGRRSGAAGVPQRGRRDRHHARRPAAPARGPAPRGRGAAGPSRALGTAHARRRRPARRRPDGRRARPRRARTRGCGSGRSCSRRCPTSRPGIRWRPAAAPTGVRLGGRPPHRRNIGGPVGPVDRHPSGPERKGRNCRRERLPVGADVRARRSRPGRDQPRPAPRAARLARRRGRRPRARRARNRRRRRAPRRAHPGDVRGGAGRRARGHRDARRRGRRGGGGTRSLARSGRARPPPVRRAGLDVLEPVARLRPDCRIGALHPLQTLPSADAGLARLPGSWAAVAGPPAVSELAEELGLRPFRVADADRALYHAAAVVASNHLVALLGQVERLPARPASRSTRSSRSCARRSTTRSSSDRPPR